MLSDTEGEQTPGATCVITTKVESGESVVHLLCDGGVVHSVRVFVQLQIVHESPEPLSGLPIGFEGSPLSER